MAGSLGYAERLSYREDLGGQLGAPEHFDERAAACAKARELARKIRQAAGNTVVHTGAGVSTAAGIPDFRGPTGIWTLQKQGKALPKASCAFDRARPTYTHLALVALEKAGLVDYLVSCNVDCLHVRSGFPRSKLAELHGNCFAERCDRCGAEYVRDFEMPSVGFKRTKRACTAAGCRGQLRDQVLDWDSPLPDAEHEESRKRSRNAKLAVTLGTSLLITPSCDIPLLTKRAGGEIVIVNLQKTPKDKHAALVVRMKVDEVMRIVMHELNLTVPPYVRVDRLRASHIVGNQTSKGTDLTVRIGSAHGWGWALPWVTAVEFDFPHHPELQPARVEKQPFQVKRRIPPGPDGNEPETCRCAIRLSFVDGCITQSVKVEYVAAIGREPVEGTDECAEAGREFSFETDRVDLEALTPPPCDLPAQGGDEPAAKRPKTEE